MGSALAQRLNPDAPHETICTMSKVNIKNYYSTKRKRDLVTLSAIVLFGSLIAFQLYIAIVFPIQLRRQHLLVAEIEKDEMYERIDRIRSTIRRNKGKTSAQTGEISLVSGIMDQFALHVREHGNEMTPEQVNGLRTDLRRFELVILGWNYANRRFLYPEETEQDVRITLDEFFGDLDAGGKIDFDKPMSFSKFFNSDHEIKFHFNQSPLDISSYAGTIETNILNSR